ncbi:MULTISPECIES: DNA-processing protein DprA [unclassified Achromobacter]|uniref:DNA-processing protein DprA n=1 Tax=unclassified Achromobacter TaxID=2626865 RepID=UPI000B51E1F4|nr:MULTISPECIES: DNA-processing protein DprA [unclassified Achromobacter]OWT75811.1 DNA-protecting protein DprA [Achromobacter sp. HZ28]OWT76471.1 DNA-protecting protein DprA [Achromobacter sp. HZ34]
MPLVHDPGELFAWLRLSLEPGLNPADAYALLGAVGLPQHLYTHPVAELAQWVPGPLARQLAARPVPALAARIAAALDWVRHPDHHLLCLADPAYPRRLLEVGDPPLLLYVHGDPSLLSRPSLAVVGARNASLDGRENAHAFAQHLAAQGWCIVSGMAAGIDAAAHEGALDAGRPSGGGTVAVLGTGIDLVYPSHHQALAGRIAQAGALVSEFALGTPALPHHFPRRNRVVAGLVRGVLVVEAASRSGSLITARLAGEYGREVFAIPGSIHSPLARGCHALIRQGAKLVECAQDITDELQGLQPDNPHGQGQSNAPPRDSDEPGALRRPACEAGNPRRADGSNTGGDTAGEAAESSGPSTAALLACLGHEPVHREVLLRRSGLRSADLDTALLRLELAGLVARRESGYFQRLPLKSTARRKD